MHKHQEIAVYGNFAMNYFLTL